jgi:AcrR family transcriptional regulator
MDTGTPPDDRTARARIRDAALYCFARDGFLAPLRTIADQAKVSVPLITHHYGTKDNLRQVCDDWVMDRFLDIKISAITDPSTVKTSMEDTSESSVLTVYMIRSFLDTTSSARAFYERYKAHLGTIIAASVAAGLASPAKDEQERLHLVAAQTLGSLLVDFALQPCDDPSDFVDRTYTQRNLEAILEFYSQPFFLPSPILDTYRQTFVPDKEHHD